MEYQGAGSNSGMSYSTGNYNNNNKPMSNPNSSSGGYERLMYGRPDMASENHAMMAMMGAPSSTVMAGGSVGAYSPEMRKERIERFMEKRKRRVWTKKVNNMSVKYNN